MKILAVSDVESKYLWEYFDKSKLKDVDLIISCGDLDPYYLSFLVTMTTAPVLYVHGNHDGRYQSIPPEGCTCIDGRIYDYQGIRILGLGCAISRGRISIRNGRCARGRRNCGLDSFKNGGLTYL